MGTRDRTRPDESRKPAPITVEGYRRLEARAYHLWNVERPRMAAAVATAAAEGDRSENAEYQYSKKKLAEIDRELAWLGARLEVLQIVHDPPPDDGRVHFGSWVRVRDVEGRTTEYRIVGPDETDPAAGLISSESPVARALLGKRSGDEVEVIRPRGSSVLTLLAVSTRPFDDSA
ncbi:MAG: GreA/GreB family elongation factor [Myxococcota bacterium]|nr:GreA/GreB family elongation factor [Myxococcota bacterium]